MGSHAHLVIGDAGDELVAWAVDELERLEQCWSRFRPDSELCRLNQRAGEWVDVSAAMINAISNARELWEATSGAFDPTTLAALEHAGYDRSFELVEAVASVAGTPGGSVRAPGFGSVEIDRTARRVRLAAGTRIDLGGIGKGLAADLVAQGLVERGARTALVALGGDMRACGAAPEPNGWPVPIEDPCDETRVAFEYPLREGGLVTSTTRIRRWVRGGQVMHHIIDPSTGVPTANGIAAVVVAGGSAWWAEGIAKAMIVAGRESVATLASRAGVRAWCFLDDGSSFETAPQPEPA